MNLKDLLNLVTDKKNFKDLNDYIIFCIKYLEFIPKNLQAVIISQNENNYQFFQYNRKGNFQITRPINSNLMYNAENSDKINSDFFNILKCIRDIKIKNIEARNIINNSIYTIQQSIGACLDALPAGKSNTARKLNGDLFENFIRIILNSIGIEAKAGVVQVPVNIEGEFAFNINYQHDLIIENNNEIKLIGSIKTSSKDRLDKIFIDKFLYSKLTETVIPHIAIFLNDVQRKNTRKENEYGINSTFLPGHFKGYTVKLNPLDGVYYCDIRPNMRTEKILKDHIKTIDNLLITDIWKFL
ncbi:MAG: hypothetical protein HW421_809 [Ignavibacteria bacterium]|nr:hypothetical protein [Ignavibacteria bacterium]